MEDFLNQMPAIAGAEIWSVAKALGILIVGWIVAHIVAAMVRGALRRTSVDDRIAAWFVGDERIKNIDLEAGIGKVFYYLIMLFVVVAAFEALQLTAVTEPLRGLLQQVMEYVPRLFSAAALLGVAWLIATGLKLVVTKTLAASNLEKRLHAGADDVEQPDHRLSQTIGEALYWFIFLLFLPGVLSALQLEGMVLPVQSMMNEVIGFLPNLFTAGVTLAVGWLVARIVQRVVSSFAAAAGFDSLGESTGIQSALGSQRLSTILGKVVYVLVFIPILISALSALGLDAVTLPLSNMLNTILAAVPAVFGALLVLAAAYWIARVVSGLVSNLLEGIGFNTMLERLGLGRVSDVESRRPSSIVGSIVLVLILLFAAAEAASMLGFQSLELMTTQILGVAGHVLFGIVLFGFGLALANFVANAISSTRAADAPLLSTLAKVATLVLTGAIALRQMGVANEIIESAFTLTLGSLAVAAAIAFGIGGRDIAARHLEKWSKSLERGGPPPPAPMNPTDL